jgi:ATP-binding cassette subfamily B protein
VSGTGRLLRGYLGRQWGAMALASASTIAAVVAQLARPFPLALVVDHLLEGRAAPFAFDQQDLRLLALLAGVVLLIAVADAAGTYVSELLLKRAGERIVDELRVDTHMHLQRLSLGYHERRHTGDLVTRVTGDVNAVGELFSQSLGTMASSLLLLLGMLVVSLAIDPVLGLIMFGVAPLLGLLTFRFRRRLRSAARVQRAKEGEIASLTAESLGAVRAVKALAAEVFEHDRLRRKSEERRQAGVETARIESRFSGLIDVLGAVGTALVLVMGALRVASGAISVGELLVLHSYMRRTYRPLRDMARQAGRISRAMARADRIAEILAVDDVQSDPPGAYSGPRARGELRLEEVSFAYDTDRQALTSLSLEVPAGQSVAVVGRSGAGKSTLAAVIARFYDAASGCVRIDGRDTRDCTLAWVRAQVGLVLQDTVLFTGTVADNISHGLEASRDRVLDAAKAAGAHAFIAELPEGYDTPLGPRGLALSGGQRQRIAIARTLLRDPPILVLDEPTNGLDPESEAQVLRGLGVLMRGRTTLVITHSMALARRAERVVAIDSGRVAQSGAPGELMSRAGLFRELATSQGLVSERPAAPGRRPGLDRRPVPDDEALPSMRHLLDEEEMASVFGRQLPPGATRPDVRVRYLRYKPSTNLVVHYDVGAGGRWHHATAMIAARAYLGRRAQKPESRRLAELVDGRSGVPTPLAYEARIGALLQWLPLDLSLPALALPPDALRRELEAAGVTIEHADAETELLAYKPRRRAVVRLEDHVLKYYADDGAFSAATAGLGASMRCPLPVPALEAAIPALRLGVQAYLAGHPVPSPAEAAGPAGATLASLHRAGPAGLPAFTAGDQLQAACASANLVCKVAPELEPRVTALVGELARSTPDTPSTVSAHGDFNARQLLEDHGRLVVTDFDEMCAAAPALDLATYCAYLVRGEAGDLERAESVLESLLEGYGARPPAMDWYLATMILRRAPRPFRYLDEHWPDRMQEMVRAAESACGR